MKDLLHIVEVSPRDGLQNEKNLVSTEVKLQLIQRLIDSGLKTIETTSFVSAKSVPAMADHKTLVAQLPIVPSVRFPALVPNQQGFDNAISCGVKAIAVFAAASETFSQKNIHRSIAKSLDEYATIIKSAKSLGLYVRGYVSCVLGCPYEGHVPLSQVIFVAKTLFEAGCDEISLGDTIGVGTPHQARQMIKEIQTVVPTASLAIHFHDTYGQALANIYACLEAGIRTVDSSVAGLGGCPYAIGASGNVATEEVVYMAEGLGLFTGISLSSLIETGQFICQQLHRPNQSKVAQARLGE